MNVLIINKEDKTLSSLNIEVIKTLRGVFSADEVVNTFGNFFFNRLILDVTALKNSEDPDTYQKLSIGLPVDKIILLIPANSRIANGMFLSNLITLGFYNFTTNADGIIYLLNNPNTYNEVSHLHKSGVPQAPMEQAQSGMPSELVQSGYAPGNSRVIGFKNLTESAGATTLIYLIKKELEDRYRYSVLCIEVNKRDFAFFRENNMISKERQNIAQELLKARDYDFVLVDLNDYTDNICDEIIYLFEPSIIKLNKLMLRDKTIFSKVRGEKIIINKSVLSDQDIRELSREAGIKIFSAIPPVNDRERPREISQLVNQLGLTR